VPADRRAALALHGLSADDRAWVLDRLDPAKRARLEPLMAELVAFGMPRGEAAPLSATDPTIDVAVANAHRQPLDVIRESSGDAILAVLRCEPPGVARLLLAVEEFPWKGSVMRLLGGASECDPHNGRAAHPVLPGPLAEAVIKSVANALELSNACSSSSAVVRPVNRWKMALRYVLRQIQRRWK